MRTATVVALFACSLFACSSEDDAGGMMSGLTSGGAGGMTPMNGSAAVGGGWQTLGGSSGASSGGTGGGQVIGGMNGAAGDVASGGATGGMSGGGGEAGTMVTTTGGAGGAGGGSAGTGGPSGPSCLQAGGGDYLANGPYGTARMDVTIGSQGAYTIFYPNPLDASCKHPIVAWGNGTAVTGADTYGFYQEHAASWGMVVVASHNDQVGSGDFHRAGLDYLLAENDNPSSMFHQKLSARAGTSGHSQGGMGANAGANHPNVEAVVNVQGAFGVAPAGKKFLCLTGTEDLNPAGCKSSVDGSSAPAMHANWEGGDHFGTATVAGFIGGDAGTKQYMRLYSAWFRCFLGDDSAACSLFMGGESCPVCGDSGWAEIYSTNY
jgi:hypothetical protein